MHASRSRPILAMLGIAVSAALLLMGSGDAATAQVQSAPAAPAGIFELTPLSHGGWVVLDTRTGSMEHWKPHTQGYEVYQAGFSQRYARLRMVYVEH